MSGRESGLTTAAVRECFAWPVHELTDEESVAAEAEFDRWLAEVERAAAEKGWDEGEQAGYEDALGEQRGIGPQESARNPYRRSEGESE